VLASGNFKEFVVDGHAGADPSEIEASGPKLHEIVEGTMKAHEIMTHPVVAVTRETTIDEAARMMVESRISGLPVGVRKNRVDRRTASGVQYTETVSPPS
jgi:predicted transcriptional regulator